MLFCARSARYSGSERPACRMNHTGTRFGLRPAAAARYGDSGSARRSLIRVNAATPQRTLDRWSTRASRERALNNTIWLAVTSGAGGSAGTRA